MAIPLDKLADKIELLNTYIYTLNKPDLKNRTEIEKAATAIILELNAELKDKDFSLGDWNQIYEVILPDVKKGLLAKETQAVQGITSAYFSGPTGKLAALINEKRCFCTKHFFDKEVALAREQYQKWIQLIINSPNDIFDSIAIKGFIRAVRAERPRVIMSVQDDIDFLQIMLIEELAQMKELGFLEGFSQLQNILGLLQGPLFSLEQAIIEASQKEKHPTGAVRLNPDPALLCEAAVDKLRIQRLFRLENLQMVYQQSLTRSNQQVACKYFEPTFAWFVGTNVENEKLANLELEMQQIGKKHGIKVISDIRMLNKKSIEIAQHQMTDLMLDCEPIVASDAGDGIYSIGMFPQDFIDFSRNGEIRMPVMKCLNETLDLAIPVGQNRMIRSPEWKDIISSFNNRIPILTLGVPFIDNLSLKAIALASSLKISPIMNLTYNEGGNTLIGKRKGEPFALIGKDSYAVSKFLMEADLGHEMTYEEILIAFALDYGVKKENIHFIEQPGDMHLDMSMTIVGENTILLNDAQEAQRMFRDEQQMWLSATSGYESAEILASYVSSEILESKARKIMEDITEKELQGLGFNVVRVPGRFNYSITAPAMNFFNMVTAQTPSGENIAVLLGCVANYASIFEQTLRKFSERKIDKVYFLNLEASQQCLGLDGGISCRTKSIPLVR